MPQRELSWWQENYPNIFQDNVEVDPQFVDEASRNFALADKSPAIDACAFLAKAVGPGTGTALRVDGDPRTVRVVAVDTTSRVLTLDRPLSLTDGQGVALEYHGRAPDLGAIEHP